MKLTKQELLAGVAMIIATILTFPYARKSFESFGNFRGNRGYFWLIDSVDGIFLCSALVFPVLLTLFILVATIQIFRRSRNVALLAVIAGPIFWLINVVNTMSYYYQHPSWRRRPFIEDLLNTILGREEIRPYISRDPFEGRYQTNNFMMIALILMVFSAVLLIITRKSPEFKSYENPRLLQARASAPRPPAPQLPQVPYGMKKCPECAEAIQAEAVKCRFCNYRYQ